MKKIGYYVLISLVASIVLVTLFAGFKAYFMFGVIDNIVIDGWGRELVKAPFPVNLILQQGSWGGLKWFIIDVVAFLGVVFIVNALFQIAQLLNK